jgi:hypothetical protein
MSGAPDEAQLLLNLKGILYFAGVCVSVIFYNPLCHETSGH